LKIDRFGAEYIQYCKAASIDLPSREPMSQRNAPSEGPMPETIRLIKKYPNRRLYDTKTSTYITLVDVKQLVLGSEEFQVVDAKTNEDLTRSILLQIILEEETGGAPMFSSDILTQFIRSYGNAMHGMLRTYLERNMQLFTEVQKRMQEQSKQIYGEPVKFNEDLWKQFMSFQGPAMQSMMSAYMEQSRNMFVQMQEQLQNQTRNMFSGFSFPGFPGFGAPAADAAKKPAEDAGKKPEDDKKP
jgi:polyhydroxyalkanoate synthesis repressor PhaR